MMLGIVTMQAMSVPGPLQSMSCGLIECMSLIASKHACAVEMTVDSHD